MIYFSWVKFKKITGSTRNFTTIKQCLLKTVECVRAENLQRHWANLHESQTCEISLSHPCFSYSFVSKAQINTFPKEERSMQCLKRDSLALVRAARMMRVLCSWRTFKEMNRTLGELCYTKSRAWFHSAKLHLPHSHHVKSVT